MVKILTFLDLAKTISFLDGHYLGILKGFSSALIIPFKAIELVYVFTLELKVSMEENLFPYGLDVWQDVYPRAVSSFFVRLIDNQKAIVTDKQPDI